IGRGFAPPLKWSTAATGVSPHNSSRQGDAITVSPLPQACLMRPCIVWAYRTTPILQPTYNEGGNIQAARPLDGFCPFH
ncbi:hypothetical protein WG66_007546, partial [Moniliophthora roreri]